MSHTLRIDSSQNDFFKTLKTLNKNSGIKKNGMFFLMGEKLIQEFLLDPTFEIICEITTEGRPFITKSPIKRTILSPSLFEEIDFLGTHWNLLLLKTKTIDSTDTIHDDVALERSLDLVVPVGDPSNLGAIIRSAEAFSIRRIYLTQNAANPYHPKSIKSSAGSVLRSHLFRISDSFKSVHPTIGLDMNGVSLNKFTWPQKSVLVLGEEGPGLNIKTELKVSIPTQNVESLNVTVASSIAMYSFSTRN